MYYANIAWVILKPMRTVKVKGNQFGASMYFGVVLKKLFKNQQKTLGIACIVSSTSTAVQNNLEGFSARSVSDDFFLKAFHIHPVKSEGDFPGPLRV